MSLYKPSQLVNPPKILDTTVFKVPRDGKIFQEDELPGIEMQAMVERIEYPTSGGLFSHLKYFKYPYKGHCDGNAVATISVTKGLMLVASVFFKELFKNPFVLLSLKGAILKVTSPMIEYAWKIMRNHFAEDPKLYCACVREIYRVFEILIGEPVKRDSPNKERLLIYTRLRQLRDTVCSIIEYDNAYRYRFQDAFSELSVEALKKYPIREISRIFKLLEEREVSQGNKDKWKKVRWLVMMLMLLNRKWTKKIVEALSQINVREIGMDKNDAYFSKIIWSYKFKYFK